MKYSPLAVHCTSLCFDVTQSQHFSKLNHEDIDAYRNELSQMIKERTRSWSSSFEREDQFVNDVTNGVILILHDCLNSGCKKDSEYILSRIEECIDGSIRLHL